MSDKPPFPATGTYLKSIRESSKSLRESAGINISQEAIERLVTSPIFTSSFERVSQAHGLKFPLKFSSYLDELNVISVLSLLNFGSGYRVPLHATTGRGAWDTTRALVLSLYLGSTTNEGDLLSAKGMEKISMVMVAELLQVDVHVERPHGTLPGVTIGELGGPMYELVKLVTEILNETGRLLVGYGYSNLGSFVLAALEEGKKAGDMELEVVLERIVRAFPGFQDMAIVNGRAIYCFKKALFLLHAIHIRFGSLKPTPFPVPDTRLSPMFADNVLPTMLMHFGVIEVGKAIGPDVNMADGYILRAAAIEAGELVAAAAGRPETEVDIWLWAVGKEGELRTVERITERGTVYY